MQLKTFSVLIISGVLSFFSLSLYAQSDSIKVHLLEKVEISAKTHPYSNLSTSPEKIVTQAKFNKVNAFQASDVLKFLSGLQVKDYGGIGGLKTVSIRNMGANYTSVAYDGIPVCNYITGQIDIGRFSLENVEKIKLNIGETDDIFLPARLQALGGSINILTVKPRANPEKKNEIKISFKTGSFGMINPTILYGTTLNRIFSINASAEYISSDGKYPYKQTHGYIDPSEKKRKRINSDVENWKLESNLFGNFNNGGKLLFKIYYFDSDRGIPGPSIYYDEGSNGERIKDKNTFSQINYSQPLNQKISLQTNAKYDFSRANYKSLRLGQSNQYDQEEYYFNISFLYQPTDNLSFSLSNDGSHGIFNSKEVKDIYRTSWLSAIAGKYETSRFTFTGSLLNHYTNNSEQNNVSNDNNNHLSPYLGLSVRPLKERSLRIRAFYKNSFRLPTFNDLYYSDVSRNLKPENAHQYNIGITVQRSSGILFPFLAFSADTYYNKVENKIVIDPRQSQVKPAVKNHGEVYIKGIDLNLEFHVNVSQSITAEISGSYTYQNVTEKQNNKKLILAYTPKHSGSGYFSLRTQWFDFNYNIIYSGTRYYTQIEEIASRMKPYSDHGVSIIKQFQYKNFNLQLSAECLNLYNKQYEVIRSYPMPGRYFRFGLKLHY